MVDKNLLLKFRQSKDYSFEMLIRDLIDYAQDLETRNTANELRLSNLEGEGGVWTPSLLFGGAAAGMTYALRTGTYRKVGTLVHFDFDIQLTLKGSSVGTATLGGLPYPLALNHTMQAFVGYVAGLALPVGTILSFLGVGSGITQMTGRAINYVSANTVVDTAFANGCRFIGNGVYVTN